MADTIYAHVGPAGALMLSQSVPGITQYLTGEAHQVFYQGKFFVCETINESAAKEISTAMGWEFILKSDFERTGSARHFQ